MGVKEIFNMKDGIKDMRRALTPEEVLPDMMVVEVDDPEQYVEEKGLDVAGEIACLIKGETEGLEQMTRTLKWNLELLADKDADKLKDIIAQKKANIAVLQEMSTTYDEIEVDKSATQSLKKLLKRSK